jgi:hypothetical protein
LPRADLPPEFSEDDRKRLMPVCRALGTSFADFIHFATMQAVDECEGLAREQDAIRQYYQGSLNGR